MEIHVKLDIKIKFDDKTEIVEKSSKITMTHVLNEIPSNDIRGGFFTNLKYRHLDFFSELSRYLKDFLVPT